MQPLIRQASLCGLKLSIRDSGIVPGQAVELERHSEQELAVFIRDELLIALKASADFMEAALSTVEIAPGATLRAVIYCH